ncbi:hypothetical protein T439DRAFT_326492 [Meredithblackwellia eburnea MCA 4105]
MQAEKEWNQESDSDNDAPEEVKSSTAKLAQNRSNKSKLNHLKLTAQAKKEKNKAHDKKLKLAKQSAVRHQQLDEEQQQFGDLDEQVEEEGEEENQEPEASTSTVKPTKTNYLDPSLFASASDFFSPHAPPSASSGNNALGKKAMRKVIKEGKRRKRELLEEREAQLKEGGARTVGSVTIQHLATPTAVSSLSASTSTTPSAKFISSRLFSKKRALAVLDASLPKSRLGDSDDEADENGVGKKRKRKHQKKGKGMSEESRILLGMGMDDGGKKAAEEEENKLASRKRHLILQGEGRRRKVSEARPLASSRASARPARDFAVSTRTR